MIEPIVDGLTHTGAGVSGPAPDFGVELAHQQALRPGSTAFDDAPTLRQMVRHLGLGGFAQGFVPEASMASGAFTRLVFVHPILPDIATPERQPGVIAFQGVAKAPFGFVQTPSYLGEPRLEQLLSVCKHLAVLVQPHAIIGVGDNPRLRVALGAGLMPPMEGNQRQPWCTAAALGRSSGGRPEVISFQDARLKPSFALATNAGGSLHFSQQGLMVDPIEAFGNVDFARILRSIPHRRQDGSDGIMTGPSGAKARGMG
jgi:hypothetical protein